MQIHSISKPSLFRDIFFWSYPHSRLIPWWEGPSRLLGKLLQIWYSFGTPRGSIKLFWYCSNHCHSQSGMGISIWDTRAMSHRDHIGVLLQYAQFRYLYTSVCYADSRYTYRSHSGSYIRDTTRPTGSASWLPRLSASEDYVQRWDSVSFLWDTVFMGWALKHLMLKRCKRSEIPKVGDDICSPSTVSL